MSNNNKLKILDLFSGAGGLSEGFWRINAEFVAHVEADKYACDTLKTRSAYWTLKRNNKINIYHKYLLKEISKNILWEQADICNDGEIIHSTIGNDTYNNIVHTIYQNMKRKNIKEIDILIGGPPCQAYSLIGRSRMGEKVDTDHRNLLFKYYVKFLHEFKPKIFLFENVPGLKNAGGGKYYKMLMEALREEYDVPEPEIYNASDFGVLQNRKRFIIIGKRKDFKCDKIDNIVRDAKVSIKHSTYVKDLLDDLPPLQPGESKEGKGQYHSPPSEYLISSGIRPYDFDILTLHIARPHNERDRNIYARAIDVWNKEKKKLKYSDLPPQWMTHKNTTSFLDRYNVVKKDEPVAQTMVAHIAKDGHYFIHPDKKQKRSLSVREAARIQSFPDDFFFEGPRTAIFTQIGNAVPPKMAELIAKKILDIL